MVESPNVKPPFLEAARFFTNERFISGNSIIAEEWVETR